ncbi:MAG: 16S rRNA (cytosine(1402)-N(4))-methyltransferase RsmH [Candidatus Zixiibacteriota bacterium]
MSRPGREVYHLPVMVVEVVDRLVTDPDGAYLDLTAGGGGHLKALAEVLSGKARLYGVDKDPAAVKWVEEALAGVSQFKKIIKSSFGDIASTVQQFDDGLFAGILLDLGLSSRQIDDRTRGFSFQGDGPLDMRFDPSAEQTAAELVNTLDEDALAEIIKNYGEERLAKRIAAQIVRERQKNMIRTTRQLSGIVSGIVNPPYQNKSLARVFQALRIAVNRELEQLQRVLPAALGLLKVGGRLAVISYHSLEDRTVKRFFQEEMKGCICPPRLPQCVCGKSPSLRIITRKPVIPTKNEIERNSRARSARLRVAEKVG